MLPPSTGTEGFVSPNPGTPGAAGGRPREAGPGRCLGCRPPDPAGRTGGVWVCAGGAFPGAQHGDGLRGSPRLSPHASLPGECRCPSWAYSHLYKSSSRVSHSHCGQAAGRSPALRLSGQSQLPRGLQHREPARRWGQTCLSQRSNPQNPSVPGPQRSPSSRHVTTAQLCSQGDWIRGPRR